MNHHCHHLNFSHFPHLELLLLGHEFLHLHAVTVVMQHEAWQVAVVAAHQMVHPFENSSTFVWFLAQCLRHAGGHDTQQNEKPSAADGASVVAAHTLQQITLLAAAVVAVAAVGVAADANVPAAVAEVPCVAGSDDFHDPFLDPSMQVEGVAAPGPVPSPFLIGCTVLDGGLLLQEQQTSVAQHDFLSRLHIAAQPDEVLHAHVVPE